ncbi:MAG: AmmeMemoRadiSam system protein B [Candidatus Ranarchaeia archaeon]
MTRYPAAKYFYPQEKQKLVEAIESALESVDLNPVEVKYDPKANNPRKVIGGVSPHAGYVFSGPACAKLMASISVDGKPDTFILLGPRHDGVPISAVMVEGDWESPLGNVKIDKELAKAFVENSEHLVANEAAHKFEHSIEVQIPFIQYLFGDFKFVPIVLSEYDPNNLKKISNDLVSIIKQMDRDVVVIASTDMTHYGRAYGYAPLINKSAEEILVFMRRTDNEAIESILNLEPVKLLEYVEKSGITMCGASPVALTLFMMKELGSQVSEKLIYTTSYESKVGGKSTDQIVGYFSGVFLR